MYTRRIDLSHRKAADDFDFGVNKMTLLHYMKKQADPDCAVGYVLTSLRHRIGESHIPAARDKDLASHISCLADVL